VSQYPPTYRPWFVRFGERTHPLLLPAVLLLLCSFALLPAYCMAAQFYAWRLGERTVAQFSSVTPKSGQVHGQALHEGPGRWLPVIVVLGTLYGSHDFSPLQWLLRIDELHWFDLWYRFSATLAWGFVFWMLAWRLLAAFDLRRLGRSLELDVYQLGELGAFVRLPLFCLLPAAALFVLPPVLGLHANMRDTIRHRVGEIQALINDCDRDDLGQLALLTEHRETLRGFPSWPVDIGLIGKVLFYLVIPPLAWVAAALVERAVDSVV